jgi:polysaccharide export outer membrane protein
MNFPGTHTRRAAIASAGLILFGAAAAWAQFAGPAIAIASPAASAPASALTAQYTDVKIMPGDVISIETYGAPELSTVATTSADLPGTAAGATMPGVKVGALGEIVLPYLGAVKVAGLTPPEASQYLAKRLKDAGILVDPQVSVQLESSPTRVITVVGEVVKPQPVAAFGQLRLLDVISACGGFTPLASHTITIRRPGETGSTTVLLPTDPKQTDAANIPLMAGDTVLVAKVGDVYVVGQVKEPKAIPLSGNAPVTVLRAISMSGGFLPGAALSRVTIVRTLPDHQHVQITLDAAKVMKGKQRDVALMSDDVLLIPRNGFKAGMANAGAGVAGGVTSGLVYRVP